MTKTADLPDTTAGIPSDFHAAAAALPAGTRFQAMRVAPEGRNWETLPAGWVPFAIAPWGILLVEAVVVEKTRVRETEAVLPPQDNLLGIDAKRKLRSAVARIRGIARYEGGVRAVKHFLETCDSMDEILRKAPEARDLGDEYHAQRDEALDKMRFAQARENALEKFIRDEILATPMQHMGTAEDFRARAIAKARALGVIP